MSEREHAGGAVLSGAPTAAARSAVPANDPVSANEVAEELGVPVGTARDALRELVEDGELAHRQVKGRASALDVWYRPEPDATVDLAARVDEALAGMDVPGASEMMQSWRRDAVRAAFEHLREAGALEASSIVDAVYATHAAGYDSEEAWWGMVAPRLGQLPGVEQGEDGEPWRFSANE
jgi:DNA-binding transcriptional regulator YhcF (GntR family)